MSARSIARAGLAWIAPVAIALLVVMLVVYRASSVPGLAPRPANGLADLQDLSALQTQFNQDIGEPRLMLLVAPT